MKKKQKNVVEGAALFSLAITAGVATAQYRANIPMKSGKFDLVSGQKNQNGAGELKEPAQENGGRDKAAKGLMPGQSIAKNPYIVSKADQSSQAYMKVNIPLFTEGAVAGKDTITLQNVSKNWVLLSDSKSDTTHTLIYGYKMKLAGDNSSKPEAERAKTDSLFTAFKITDEAVTSTFVGSLDVYGMLTQSEKGDIKLAFQDAEFNSDLSEDVFMISYDLKGGTLEGQKYLYTKDDYGYTPPTPTKDKYTFTGWSPAKIAEGSNSDIVFSAGWVANKLGSILYNLNGGSLKNQKTSYTVEDYGYTPPTPTRANYTFVSWSPASIASGSNGDITFTANWKATVLGNIKYNLNGGSISGQKTSYTVENYNYAPPTPTRTGYAFTGWSPANIASDTKGDVTFTANWKEKTAEIDNNKLHKKINAKKSTLTSFVRTTAKPSASVMVDDNIISTSSSSYPVYAWANSDGSTISWYSEANRPKLGSGCSWMFFDCKSLTDISGLASLDTGNVTKMSSMFNGCSRLTNISALSSWNTGNVGYMSRMFSECTSLTNASGINDWNLSCLESGGIGGWTVFQSGTHHMFYNCPSHPEFTKRAGTWDSDGTFIPTD